MRANAVTNRVKCKVAAILKNETGQSYRSICNEELTSFLRFRVSFIKKGRIFKLLPVLITKLLILLRFYFHDV